MTKYCSAEYLTNNLLKPVLFEEASKCIPENAIIIEIAPHGLLQAILKRAHPNTCTNVSLTRKSDGKSNLNNLLGAIGRYLFFCSIFIGENNNRDVLYTFTQPLYRRLETECQRFVSRNFVSGPEKYTVDLAILHVELRREDDKTRITTAFPRKMFVYLEDRWERI